MSIIIPSKQIYSIDNKKVKNNVILGTTVQAPAIEIPKTDINTFEWQPFTMSNTGGVANFIVFSKNEIQSSENIDIWDSAQGAVLYSNIRLKFKLSDYIDLKNLGFSFSYQYVYGKSADNTGAYRRLISVEDAISKTIKTDFTEYYYPIIPSKDNIPYLYMTSEITYPDEVYPSKELTVIFSIPIEYWSPESGLENADCCFITNMKIVLSAPMFNFSNTRLVEFGKRGDKIFDIPSNNLSVAKYKGTNIFEHISNKTIGSYKYGKETATIRAGIGEYYLEDGTLAISTKRNVNPLINWYTENNSVLEFKEKSYGQYEYKVPANLDILWYNNIGKATLESGEYKIKCIYPKESYGRIRLNQYNETGDDKDRFADLPFANDFGYQEQIFTLNTEKDIYLHYCSDAENTSVGRPQFAFEVIIKRLSDGNLTKMTFDIGDKVTPMVRRADGTDAPMSRTTSGSAKAFRVCGTKIYYDGAVWQELTLQEV